MTDTRADTARAICEKYDVPYKFEFGRPWPAVYGRHIFDEMDIAKDKDITFEQFVVMQKIREIHGLDVVSFPRRRSYYHKLGVIQIIVNGGGFTICSGNATVRWCGDYCGCPEICCHAAPGEALHVVEVMRKYKDFNRFTKGVRNEYHEYCRIFKMLDELELHVDVEGILGDVEFGPIINCENGQNDEYYISGANDDDYYGDEVYESIEELRDELIRRWPDCQRRGKHTKSAKF